MFPLLGVIPAHMQWESSDGENALKASDHLYSLSQYKLTGCSQAVHETDMNGMLKAQVVCLEKKRKRFTVLHCMTAQLGLNCE